MITQEIIWDNVPDIDEKDDFTVRVGQYTLRVEQMDKRRWWWCVYFNNQTISDCIDTKTKLEAQLMAELCYIKHFLKNNNQ